MNATQNPSSYYIELEDKYGGPFASKNRESTYRPGADLGFDIQSISQFQTGRVRKEDHVTFRLR